MQNTPTHDDKRKHLEMIQGVINRMASNSFLFKGWSITIIAGISAFATKEVSLPLMLIPVTSTLLFWSVDAYYLAQERLFRSLYNTVAELAPIEITYSMKTAPMIFSEWFRALWRPMLLAFYGTVLIMLIALVFILGMMQVDVRLQGAS